MNVLPRDQWTPAHLLSVAHLITAPESNGGTVSELTPEQVAAGLPDTAPAWAVFDGDRAVFVVGMWPFQWNPEMTRMRGILHVAGTGEQREAWRVVQAFLGALPGVEVFTFTDRPALARLAHRAGLEVVGRDGDYLILTRASQGTP